MVAGVRFVELDESFIPQSTSATKYCYTIRSTRGPLGTDVRNPMEIRTYSKLVENYGEPIANLDDHLELKQALDRGATLYVSRVASSAAAKATVVLQDQLGVAGAAQFQSSVGPFNFEGATDLVFNINGTPASAINFTHTAATQTSEDPGGGATGWNLGGETLIVTVKLPGQTTDTVYSMTFSDTGVTDADNFTQVETINQINANVGGVAATVVGNTVRLTTDKEGSGATIAVTGTASGASFLNMGTAVAGTGNVADINFATAAEVKTVVDAASLSGLAAVVVTTDGRARFLTTATGASATLQFNTPSLAAAAMGFTVGVGGQVTGTNSAAQQNTLRIEAESESDDYNGFSFTIAVNSVDSTLFDLTIPVQTLVATAESHQQLSMNPESQRYVVRILSEESNWLRAVNLNSSKAVPDNNPVAGSYSLTGGDRGVTGIVPADFEGTASNRRGVHGFDDVRDAQDLFVPGLGAGNISTRIAERDQVFSIANYCSGRGDMLYYFATFPEPNDAGDCRDWVLGNGAYSAGTIFNSSYITMFAGRPVEVDFSGERRELYGTGHLGGVLAYNDTGLGRLIRDFGVQFAAAGVKRALVNSVGLGSLNVGAPSASATTLVTLEEAQINSFADFGSGVQIHDQRNSQRAPTLLRENNVRRFLIKARRESLSAIRAEQWDPLDPIFFKSIFNRLDPLWQGYQDSRAVTSFRIRCDQRVNRIEDVQVNNLNDLQNGKFKCVIYFKPTTAAREIVLVGVVSALTANFDEIVG